MSLRFTALARCDVSCLWPAADNGSPLVSATIAEARNPLSPGPLGSGIDNGSEGQLTFMSALDPFIQRTHIAYLSMEIALRAEMHTYAGGLGVLAGDMARSSADLELPIVFVSLISRAGYVRQDIDRHGRQVTKPNPWQPKDWMDPLDAMVAVTIEGREVPGVYKLTFHL